MSSSKRYSWLGIVHRVYFFSAPEWRNGRRGGLKNRCLTTCEFDSRLGHHISARRIPCIARNPVVNSKAARAPGNTTERDARDSLLIEQQVHGLLATMHVELAIDMARMAAHRVFRYEQRIGDIVF